MAEQRLGVLGGMGPQATQVFYQRLIDRTLAHTDQDHLQTLIFSDSAIPDRTQAILSGEEGAVLARLLADAKMLEGCGCTALAIPCNTAHHFAHRLQVGLTIPIVNMVRLTCQAVARQGCGRVAILATDGTVETGLYQAECAALGVECLPPPPDIQAQVMHLIYDVIKAGERGAPEDFEPIHRAVAAMGCQGAILGCTELSVFGEYHQLPPFYVDAMEVLARASILACGKRLRNVEPHGHQVAE